MPTTTAEPIDECMQYTPPPPALKHLYVKLKPHLNVTSREPTPPRKSFPSYRKLIKDINKVSPASGSFKQRIEGVISKFQAAISESIASQLQFFESTRINMLFQLKNFVQKSYNAFTDLVDQSFENSGVCTGRAKECWDKLQDGLPRFMDEMNQEIVTCDDIFNANMENPRGVSVRQVTVNRISQEFGHIQSKCLGSGHGNTQTLTCLMKSLPHYVPRSAAYFSSLQNVISQGTNLMGIRYNDGAKLLSDGFNNGMTKLNRCVQGGKSNDVALNKELDK
uniref:Uncharacterized protein n=1 Tax=Anopheles stephensi TaxID=30069 RepID=A0A182Y5V4_ANOST